MRIVCSQNHNEIWHKIVSSISVDLNAYYSHLGPYWVCIDIQSHPLNPSSFNAAFVIPAKSEAEMPIAEIFAQTTDYVNLHANSVDPDQALDPQCWLYGLPN